MSVLDLISNLKIAATSVFHEAVNQ